MPQSAPSAHRASELNGMSISKLYIYPIKSLRPVELSNMNLTVLGPEYDRCFMLLQVMKGNTLKDMHVSRWPEMCLFQQELIQDHTLADGPKVRVSFEPPSGTHTSIEVPLRPGFDKLDQVDVSMYKSATKGYNMGSKYNDWFSECFGYDVLLVYLGSNTRPVLFPNINGGQQSSSWASKLANQMPTSVGNILGYQQQEPQITFADCAPYLICSDTSLQDVSSRLPDGEVMDMTKFRPNIVITGAQEAWDEDFWAEIDVDGVKFLCKHNCGRCQSINVDYNTGKPGTGEAGKMLKKLSSNRRVDPGMKYSPIFGRYSFLDPEDDPKHISVGNEVCITKRNDERTIFDWPSLTTLPKKEQGA